MKKLIILAGALALAAVPALADVGAELGKAGTHAGLAAKATAIEGVHMHLHHALNCLVGPAGEGFDASNMNPCAKDGNGAIPDGSDAQKAKLMAAVSDAKAGIANTDLAGAQADAQKTADAIMAAK